MREAGFTEQRQPPAPGSGRITGCCHLGSYVSRGGGTRTSWVSFGWLLSGGSGFSLDGLDRTVDLILHCSLWVQSLPLCCFFLLACADEVSRGGGTRTSWVSFGWLLSGGSGFSLDGLDRTVDLILHCSLWVQSLPLCCFFLLACADEVSRGGGTRTSWVSFGWLLSGGSGFSLDGLDRTVDLILHCSLWVQSLPLCCFFLLACADEVSRGGGTRTSWVSFGWLLSGGSGFSLDGLDRTVDLILHCSLWVQSLPLCCFFLLACADEVSRGGGTRTSWVSFGWLLSGGSGFSLDGLDRTVDLILHWILPITCMITMMQRLHRSMQIACICIYGMRDAFIQAGVAFEGGNWLSLLVLRLNRFWEILSDYHPFS
ncbi:hypothetical protein NC653_023337 [Populus alba x Populus x berolinensis]|uniref:Uncharacterized protein n=1 Tax=Populus alba x Populus x berolinensis TaxID=444605 RepID=A0AAD6QAT8_9ROSI|nr:hypothetical protein NC653_023337 [Populus alba x Populus x berolinensis]